MQRQLALGGAACFDFFIGFDEYVCCRKKQLVFSYQTFPLGYARESAYIA